MKKTLTVNLNNTVFHIDDDAYEALKKYLSEISLHFASDDDRDEIMNDIEARIAELFFERLQDNKQVITIIDVNEVIKIMGNPNEFSDSENEKTSQEKTKSEKKQKKVRRFYRDPENAILGGIAGGIAAYFNVDVVLVRIILVLLVFLGLGITIPIYIIAWIITPAATTAAQRLEMQGEDVTIENIKNYVQSDKFKNSAKNVGNTLSNILLKILKVFVVFIGIILGFAGFVILATLIATLVLLFVNPAFFEGFGGSFYWMPERNLESLLIIFSGILVVACPLAILIYGIVRMCSKRKRKFMGTFFWVILVIWIISLITLFRANSLIVINSERGDYSKRWRKNYSKTWTWSNNNSSSSQIRTLDDFHSIKISEKISLYLTQDSVQQVEVITRNNLFPKIKTEVKDGILIINTEKETPFHTPKIYIKTPILKRIDTHGAVSIETENTLRLKNFILATSGANDIKMDVIIDSLLYTEIDGVADLNLSGSSKYLEIKVDGTGDIDTEDLKAEHVKIRTRGASSIEVYASESIDIDTKGLGEVKYSGNPKVVKR